MRIIASYACILWQMTSLHFKRSVLAIEFKQSLIKLFGFYPTSGRIFEHKFGKCKNLSCSCSPLIKPPPKTAKFVFFY